MIKIVTIDLDGTLFDKNKKVSKENIETIRKCKEIGCHIVIATGRPLSGVMPTLEELGLTDATDYAIIYNGAKVFNVKTKEIIFNSSITGKDVLDLYHESKRLNVFFHAFRLNEELIAEVSNPYTDVEARINHIKEKLIDFSTIKESDLFLKAMLVGSDCDVTRVMQDVNPLYKEKYSFLRSSTIFSEFLNKNSDKGQALAALANYLNVDMKDTMAIGDAGNDIPMIQASGIGVAMENAFPEVLEIADFITKSNENSGVAYALNKFVLNKKA